VKPTDIVLDQQQSWPRQAISPLKANDPCAIEVIPDAPAQSYLPPQQQEQIMKISIIGDGNVGGALAKGLKAAGHAVETTGNDAAAVARLAASGEVIILAAPYAAYGDIAKTIGTATDGKPVIDASNIVSKDMGLGIEGTSGAEELQKKLPNARVVKAFNTVFAGTMHTGTARGKKLSALFAGDDAGAKATVAKLAADIGYDPLDAGPLKNARLLEALGILNIQLGYVVGLGTDIGISYVH
jgi:predicted dinucleotide-binding enzyme